MTGPLGRTPAEVAELDQLRAGAEAELDDKIEIVRELFATHDEDTANDILIALVGSASDGLVRGGFALALTRLARGAGR